jgi:hypothetical protein
MTTTQIQLKRDTAANWTSINRVLSDGEIGIETDTLKFKIGNGTTAWNSLAYDENSTPSHTHPESDVTNLTTDLSGKAASSHSHAPTDVTGTAVITNDSRLSDARTPTAHNQAISTVTGLQTALDGKEAANANIQTHVTSAHAPSNAQKNSDITKAEVEAKLTGEISTHTHAGGGGGLGYAINVQALTSSPTDAQTVYFGMLPKTPTTTANISKVYIRKAGTIKIAEIYCYSGTAGTGEAWSLYIRKNNSADTLIATLSVATSERVFSNAALSVAVAVGDYIEIKGIQPTWVTNPLTCIYAGYIYIE